MNAGIDRTWLCDQIPQLQDLSLLGQQELPFSVDCLLLVEAQQFKPTTTGDAEGIEPRILQQLERFNLSSDKIFLFGRNSELPQQDTLDFTQLELWI